MIVKSRYGKDYKAATNEINNLGNGIRFGFTDELTDQNHLDVRSVKDFSGETEISMRKNYQDTQRGWAH